MTGGKPSRCNGWVCLWHGIQPEDRAALGEPQDVDRAVRVGGCDVATFGGEGDAMHVRPGEDEAEGARADRRELLKMLDRLQPGQVVTVTRIDRLACSAFDLVGIIKRIVEASPCLLM